MNATRITCSCGGTGGHACDCCTGPHIATPAPIFNVAGLSAIERRAGTWGTFRSTMQARLSSFQDFPALPKLTTREPDDPSIAFLDAAAVVCDVLTFYSERLANEGFLRTATQRRSLMELGKLVGYRPRPGVAASAWLAFTLDTDYVIEIPAGTRAQSVPSSPDETAQTFETSSPLSARYELNVMPARRSIPQEIAPANVLNIETLYFKGTGLSLKAGDMLLFVFPDDEFSNTPRKIHTVAEDSTNSRTTVKLVVEKLSTAYYLPVLRKSAQALRQFLANRAASSQTWAKNLTGSLDRFTAKLGADTSLLDIEEYFRPDAEVENDAGLVVYLDAVAEEAAVAGALITGLPLRAAWQTKVKSGLGPLLARAATQEALLLEVFAQLEIIDAASSQLGVRKAAAAAIVSLLDPDDNGQPGAVMECFEPVSSRLRNLRTIAALAAAAENVSAWNASGMGPVNPSAQRQAVNELGLAAGDAQDARTDAMELLAAAATQLDDAATFSAAAGSLFDSGTGTLLKLINAADTPPVIGNLLTNARNALMAVWTPLENTMKAPLSAGAATDETLNSAASTHAALLAAVTSAADHQARATAMSKMAADCATLYSGTDDTAGIESELAFIASAGTLAAALSTHHAQFQSESVAGFKSSILLLTGRYRSSVAAITTVADELKRLEDAVGSASAATPLDSIHDELRETIKVVNTALGTTAGTTLERLRAELEILSGQVAVSPSGASSVVASGTAASSAALGSIVAGTTLQRPAAPGDPMAVERSLKAFVSNLSSAGGVASDAVSRLAGKLAGSTDDELFEAWRNLNTGTPAVEIYAMRVQSAVFGAGAPMRFGTAADTSFDKRFDRPGGFGDWVVIPADIGGQIRLDGEHSKVVRESYLVIERPLSVEVETATTPGPSAAIASASSAPGAGDGGILDSPPFLRNASFEFHDLSKLVTIGNLNVSTLRGTAGAVIFKGHDGRDYTTFTESRVRRVQDVSITPHSAYSLSGKVTTVSLLQETEWGKDAALGFGVIRGTKVYAASELLSLDEQPVARVVGARGAEEAGSIARSSDNPFS